MPLARELELRLAQVDERAELVDSAVAVVVERDEGREVERSADLLLRKRARRIGEVVVAVDENARALVGKRARQALDGDVREAEVERALHVQLFVLLATAR